MHPVNLGRLRRDGHVLYTREAAAVLHEVCGAVIAAQSAGRVPTVPSPDELWVTPEGAVQFDSSPEGGDPRAVMPALGALAEALLPPFSQEPDYAVPMSFRLLAPRARGKPGLPVLSGVAAFLAAVRRFESAPSAVVLQELAWRVRSPQPASVTGPGREDATAAAIRIPEGPVLETAGAATATSPPRGRGAPAGTDEPAGEIPLLGAHPAPSGDDFRPVRITLEEPDHSASSVTPSVPPGPPVARREGVRPVAALVLALLAGVAAAALGTASYLRDAEPIAQRWRLPATGSPVGAMGEFPAEVATDATRAEPSGGGNDTSAAAPVADRAATGTAGAFHSEGRLETGAASRRDVLAPRALAFPGVSGPVFSPAFDAAGAALVFHAGRNAAHLMHARLSGAGAPTEVTSLLAGSARDYHPRPSPDGDLIAFDSDRDGERGVYLASRDGSAVRRISGRGFAAVPSWSPDATRLAFVRAEPLRSSVWNLWMYTLAGGGLTRVTSHSIGQMWGASWFPDGERICYSHEDRLVVRELATGREQAFPSPVRRRLVRTPAVSPDGTRVVFQLRRDGIWLLELSDGIMRRLLEDPTAEEFSWHPSGDRIAYHSRRDGEWRIWVMSAPR
jgi:Tol biopolymer transport system component